MNLMVKMISGEAPEEKILEMFLKMYKKILWGPGRLYQIMRFLVYFHIRFMLILGYIRLGKQFGDPAELEI